MTNSTAKPRGIEQGLHDKSFSLDALAKQFGFGSLAVTGLELGDAPQKLHEWLGEGFHGEMGFLKDREALRINPGELVPGAVSAMMLTMPYVSKDGGLDIDQEASHANVSLYARGRDYHKVVRKQLAKFAQAATQALQTQGYLEPSHYRVFCDSAPLMEVELARRAGLGWRGKHSLLIDADAGSMFFLGAVLSNVPLEQLQRFTLARETLRPDGQHCGTCQRCIDLCPTKAIVAPYKVDARRCISYLTIELKGTIPIELRPLLGNRVLGCDDCQLVCPWNKFAKRHSLPDFDAREPWSGLQLVEAFSWDEQTYLKHTEGSAIRRVGHVQWQRNLAVAMGNALAQANCDEVLARSLREALASRLAANCEPMLAEHIEWALAQA